MTLRVYLVDRKQQNKREDVFPINSKVPAPENSRADGFAVCFETDPEGKDDHDVRRDRKKDFCV